MSDGPDGQTDSSTDMPFLQAHLQVVCVLCVQNDLNLSNVLGGVMLKRNRFQESPVY